MTNAAREPRPSSPPPREPNREPNREPSGGAYLVSHRDSHDHSHPDSHRAGAHRAEPYEAASVRPYAVTGGRVQSALNGLPLEALVEVLPAAVDAVGLTPEKRAILRHAGHEYVSIAELAALLRLPVGVVRILVGDLHEAGYLVVHTSAPVAVNTGEVALSLSVLESVLSGLATL